MWQPKEKAEKFQDFFSGFSFSFLTMMGDCIVLLKY